MKTKLAFAMLLLTTGAATAHDYKTQAYTLPTTYVQPQQKHVKAYTLPTTYVQPYERAIAANSRENNWSSKPNINTYTGKEGSKDPYANPYGH